jgi:hypothetical protein
MHTTVSDPRVWQRWSEARQVSLLTAFEDSATGTRVKDFCQELSRYLGEHCQLIEHVWIFSTFRFRELREIAAEEASASDLVIISVHDTESLPEEVKGWVDLWLQQKGTRKTVLLALLDPAPNGTPRALEAYLQEVARRGGLELMVESGAVSEARWQAR